jgi:hypothetical protein
MAVGRHLAALAHAGIDTDTAVQWSSERAAKTRPFASTAIERVDVDEMASG